MSDNIDSIEDRINDELHHLLDFMEQCADYSDDYKSMIGHLVRVLEIRQRESDNKNSNAIKLRELGQQKDISDANNAIKLQELEQNKALSGETHAMKLKELQQQKEISDAANAIKLKELELKNIITKEMWLTVGTHVAGLIILMNHERAHVIASKAFGLLKKIV